MLYENAVDEKGNIIHISQVNPQNRGSYTCLECKKPLIAKLGRIKEHHFAHKVQFNCNPEGYLHKLAKKVFIEEYEKCLAEKRPFYLEYRSSKFCTSCQDRKPLSQNCDLYPLNKFDLTKAFNLISEETYHEGFKPDILLHSDKREDVIFIEIAVTHQCEENKVDSGIRIIEFDIQQQEEIELLKRDSILLEEVNHYNFQTKSQKGEFNNPLKCKHETFLFLVYKSGKVFMAKVSRSELEKSYKYNSIQHAEKVDERLSDHFYGYENVTFLKKISEASRAGFKISNCFLCRYHRKKSDSYRIMDNPIFCKYLRKEVSNSNYAADCQYYRIDEAYRNLTFDEFY